MTETAIRHEVEVDERIAAAYMTMRNAETPLSLAVTQLHIVVRDTKVRRAGWMRTTAEVVALAYGKAEGRNNAAYALENYDAAKAAYELASAAYEAVSAEYEGWSRFFLVPGGHIHSSMHCSTCNNGKYATLFAWQPRLSGLDEAAAVQELGPFLCSVCFPSAPVEWTQDQAEQVDPDLCPGSGQPRPGRTYGFACPVCGKGMFSQQTGGNIRKHKRAE